MMMDSILNVASRVNALPLINRLSPSATRDFTEAERQGHFKCQSLAQKCMVEIAPLIQEGWTENKAAHLIEIWLRDHGVKAFFHKPFVWWGKRTRYEGVKNYWDYLPTERRLVKNEVFIFDVAPILDGFVADIGFSGVFGAVPRYQEGIEFLADLRREIPMIAKSVHRDRLWFEIDAKMKAQNWKNIHKTYPFGVLGHRLHRNSSTLEATFIHFGWQSYWDILSRGLFGQLLNEEFRGDLRGLWAIEPHIGCDDFGVKFEEILVVTHDDAYWLSDQQYISTADAYAPQLSHS
jgi:Xaa-Pro aminopeptidase